jgi:hypothetical protein
MIGAVWVRVGGNDCGAKRVKIPRIEFKGVVGEI